MSRREAGPNPFHIPADEEIFRYREDEKLLRTQSRLVALTASVAEKSTFASRMQATAAMTEGKGSASGWESRPGGGSVGSSRRGNELSLAAASAGAVERRKEKENMSELIAKKREIFLLQVRERGCHVMDSQRCSG